MDEGLSEMQIAIGGDHAGFALKSFLYQRLVEQGHDLHDLGTHSSEQVDYPPFCIAVGEVVARGKADWGIVLGGSGQGEQIAANKVPGVRAALCNEPHYAMLARRDNDANILALGARIVANEYALEIVKIWMRTTFDGGRHARRNKLIATYEAAGHAEL